MVDSIEYCLKASIYRCVSGLLGVGQAQTDASHLRLRPSTSLPPIFNFTSSPLTLPPPPPPPTRNPPLTLKLTAGSTWISVIPSVVPYRPPSRSSTLSSSSPFTSLSSPPAAFALPATKIYPNPLRNSAPVANLFPQKTTMSLPNCPMCLKSRTLADRASCSLPGSPSPSYSPS